MIQHGVSEQGDQVMEIFKSHLVYQLCLLLLAEADGHHFHQTAFVRRYEHRMGLDAIDDDDAVRFRRMAVDLYNMAFCRPADNLGLHRADDRAAAAFLCYAKRGQHITLSVCCGAGMTAHSRDDKGVCSVLEAEFCHGMHDSAEIGDTAAAAGDGHRHTGLDAVGEAAG